MHLLYLVSVWLHVLAATVWIGGMFFLVLVVVPWMRRGNQGVGVRLLRDTGARFRNIGWTCFAIALVTGVFNLWFRGVRLETFVNPAWHASAVGRAVLMKLVAFVVVLLVSGFHDLVVGPRAVEALEADPQAEGAQRLRRQASLLGRLNAGLSLALVALGIVIVRGCP